MESLLRVWESCTDTIFTPGVFMKDWIVFLHVLFVKNCSHLWGDKDQSDNKLMLLYFNHENFKRNLP